MENLEFHVARKRMIEEQLIPGCVRDKKILKVFEKVPRHRFVEKGLEDQAYLDRPISIGFGQTISQPLIVGLMTQALHLKGDEKVLEVGSGSGYQAAILAALASKVYTIERVAELSLRARKVLYRLGYNNIEFRIGDGSLGWIEAAPFDAIVVTAGGPKIPETLKHQLKEGGKLVMPIGSEESQKLVLVERKKEKWLVSELSACRFVKLIGKEGWPSE